MRVAGTIAVVFVRLVAAFWLLGSAPEPLSQRSPTATSTPNESGITTGNVAFVQERHL